MLSCKTVFKRFYAKNKIKEVTGRKLWKDEKVQKDFLNQLSIKLDISRPEDWYRVMYADIIENGGKRLLAHHKTFPHCLLHFFPVYDLKFWKFEHWHLKSFWESVKYQRQFIDHLEKVLNLGSSKNWSDVTTKQVIDHGGEQLLEQYGGSLQKVLAVHHPDVKLYPYFDATKMDWADKKFRLEFLDQLLKKLELQNRLLLTRKQVLTNGGRGFLEFYGDFNALPKAFQDLYPDKEVEITYRQHKNHWTLMKQREAFDSLGKHLSINTFQDWFRVKLEEIPKEYTPIITQYHSFRKALRNIYPEYSWEEWEEPISIDEESVLKSLEPKKYYRSKSGSVGQLTLFQYLKQLVSDKEIYQNYLHPDLKYANDEPMELDVYIPEWKLAFEYQGHQHIDADKLAFGYSDVYKKRDIYKRNACNANKIHLIAIPYWWNLRKGSLQATLHEERPDLFPNPGFSKPILKTKPPNWKKTVMKDELKYSVDVPSS